MFLANVLTLNSLLWDQIKALEGVQTYSSITYVLIIIISYLRWVKWVVLLEFS